LFRLFVCRPFLFVILLCLSFRSAAKESAVAVAFLPLIPQHEKEYEVVFAVAFLFVIP
jgi:hypothetical protein